MKRERKSSPDIKLTRTDSGAVPTISFAAENSGNLTAERFDIGGNLVAAYYDASHKLIFVLDHTADKRTPNVLLVMNGDPDDRLRKWDDILSNDYDVDLETIRPKKNNKYQKLDIEYDGLSIYNQLINAIATHADLTPPLAKLSAFRDAAAARQAAARLAAANEQMRKATETIAETEISINNAHANIKQLKEKLSKIKQKVGKEPTKESAAKILRAQSKIEMAGEKRKRAELRLRRAHRRLEDAKNDAAAASARLAATGTTYQKTEPKVIEMPEEVKPLFTKDPEIMDERMAFKPIDFDPSPRRGAEAGAPPMQHFTPPPLKLTPVPHQDAEAFDPSPHSGAEVTPNNQAYTPHVPLPPAPTSYAPPVPPAHLDRPAPLREEPIRIPAPARSGPGVMYYFMLIILIALSILTLWLYQNRMTNAVPNILKPLAPEATAEQAGPGIGAGIRAMIAGMFARSETEEEKEQRSAARRESLEQLAAPEPVVRPASELADAGDAFLDDQGFMRPVTLPARIPEDMPEDFQMPPAFEPEMPAPAAEPADAWDDAHFANIPSPALQPMEFEPVFEEETVWEEQSFDHIPSPTLRPIEFEPVAIFDDGFEAAAIFEEEIEWDEQHFDEPMETVTESWAADEMLPFVEEPQYFDTPEEHDYDIAPFAEVADVWQLADAAEPTFEPEAPAAAEEVSLICEDGTNPDADGCCGNEILTDMPGFGAACCPDGMASEDACFPPLG